MSINLVKGQKIDLTKTSIGLSKVMVGLGWDPMERRSGIFGGLFSGAPSNIDCDASAILLDANNKMRQKSDLIYYGNLRSRDQSIIHQGDNLTGDGDGDDEQIMIDLTSVSSEIKKIVFVVNIYEAIKRRQDFGMIQNAFIRVVNLDDNNELCKFNLSEDYAGKTSLIVGEIYRENDAWKFGAVGQATNDSSLSELIRIYK